MLKNTLIKFTVLASCFLPFTSVHANEEVNVYSYRQANLVKPLFDVFTKSTGIKVNVVFAKKGMAERLAREGEHSPADVLLTTDISRLIALQDKDLIQPVSSTVLESNVPAHLQANDNTWFALTTRVRNIYSSKRLGNINVNYEDLADPKWQGRICTRSGKHPYTVALVASMIAEHGEQKTLEWLNGFKANLARKPQGNDRGQVQAIHQNLCDLSLGNSYYFGKMLTNPEQKVWADAVNINFPNQNNRGAHINISGVAMAKHAPNRDNALALMEFLISEQAQQMYAEANMEYPVRKGVPLAELVASWGNYKADDLPLATIAKHRKAAISLLDQAKFDL
ncbi:Fe(3+) ABC transporter substrate-binding protein [Thalassotalea sp. 1_MG-2023]|uniref:Fe(3+) ABC transporter substrate-binding protein n=1 Tax=Thalassotalea sp. 1_MG-2023 TaxID=3062680 RepID=UPI0026E262CD|nr:Fe(3+) ABC transporter substrate-binding protein [Thalassotalea sp. 1_MG-2023]MDO6427169.1 Fe(3+) ABC transporter substrate-binding protein [Thalassotalea sp. 1_MG-2023]